MYLQLVTPADYYYLLLDSGCYLQAISFLCTDHTSSDTPILKNKQGHSMQWSYIAGLIILFMALLILFGMLVYNIFARSVTYC